MREASKVESNANVRTIEGKAFYQRDGVWVDGAFDASKAKPEIIAFGSADYLKLLSDKKLAKWLSVGDRVIIVLPNRGDRSEIALQVLAAQGHDCIRGEITKNLCCKYLQQRFSGLTGKINDETSEMDVDLVRLMRDAVEFWRTG